jgi:hypothetical protein
MWAYKNFNWKGLFVKLNVLKILFAAVVGMGISVAQANDLPVVTPGVSEPIWVINCPNATADKNYSKCEMAGYENCQTKPPKEQGKCLQNQRMYCAKRYGCTISILLDEPLMEAPVNSEE